MRLRGLVIGGVIAGVLAGCGASASGQVFARATEFGPQTATVDPRQALEFLDIPLTYQISWPQMNGVELQPGGMFEGWRYASPQEVNELFVSANIMPNNGVYANQFAVGFNPELFDLQQLLGFWENPGNGERLTVGWTSETRNDGFLESRVGYLEVEVDFWQYGTGFWQQANNPLTITGSFLVRDRPGCLADLVAPVGVLNFFDIAEFIALYNADEPGADLAAPFGTLNFFDIAEFIRLYNLGC